MATVEREESGDSLRFSRTSPWGSKLRRLTGLLTAAGIDLGQNGRGIGVRQPEVRCNLL
jgi:hypothetical protein